MKYPMKERERERENEKTYIRLELLDHATSNEIDFERSRTFEYEIKYSTAITVFIIGIELPLLSCNCKLRSVIIIIFTNLEVAECCPALESSLLNCLSIFF